MVSLVAFPKMILQVDFDRRVDVNNLIRFFFLLSLVASLVHETEKRVEINLVVLAACDYLIHNCLQVIKGVDVRNVSLCHRLAFSHTRSLNPWVLLNVLLHIKQTLKVSESVICLTLIDLTVELTLTGTICASLIN